MLNKIICAALAGTVVPGVLAQNISDIQGKPSHSAYVQDGRGTIARSAYGLCWRTGYWSAADAVPGCDGELAPPIAKPIAPPVAAAPAPEPVAPPPPKRCDFTATLQNDETFSFNRVTLSDAAIQRLDSEVLPRLDACSSIETVHITGHTDQLGTIQYNQKLAEKRASAVAEYIRSRKPDTPVRITAAGESEPVTTCSDQLSRPELIACLGPNRRVTVEVRGRTNK